MVKLINVITGDIDNIKDKEVLDKIYYLQYRIPNLNEVSKKEKQEIKNYISKIDNKFPLYDIKTKNMYLINRNNVNESVLDNHYRLPDEKYYKILKNKNKNFPNETKNVLVSREKRKLDLILFYLNQFNLKILKKKYKETFKHKDITICIRPCYAAHFNHINPYYTKSELVNLALNMDIIKVSEKKKLSQICYSVKQNDINASAIVNHQNHIIKSGATELVQYYSLQGSYYINKYLRGITGYNTKNNVIEKMSKKYGK